MTATQKATIAAADHILKAPGAHIEAEPPECLIEILDTVIKDLKHIKEVGILWRSVQLEMLREKTLARRQEKR